MIQVLLTEFKGEGEGGLGKSSFVQETFTEWSFVPGTILGAGNGAVNKAQTLLLSHR